MKRPREPSGSEGESDGPIDVGREGELRYGPRLGTGRADGLSEREDSSSMRSREMRVWATALRCVCWGGGAGRVQRVPLHARVPGVLCALGHLGLGMEVASVQLAGLMSSCDFLFRCPDETIGKEFFLKLLGKTLIDCWHHTPCLEFADYAE